MAEAFGLAANIIGVASFSIQLADSILKLKEFVDKVKEAPEMIQYLIAELEMLNSILIELQKSDEEAKKLGVESSVLKRSYDFCSQGSSMLDTVVKEMQGKIESRSRIASLKAVLKMGCVERLRYRVRDAQSMLLLARLGFSEALQTRRHEISRQWSETHEKLLGDMKVSVSEAAEVVLFLKNKSSPDIHGSQKAAIREGDVRNSLELTYQPSLQGKLLNKDTGRKSVRGKQNDLVFRLRAPSWTTFESRYLDVYLRLYLRRSLFEFSVGVRKYRVVSADAPIMEFVRKGNLVGMQEMFTRGTASPNDRTTSGMTVLGMAIWHDQLEVCRLLKHHGADDYAIICQEFVSPAIEHLLLSSYPPEKAQVRLDVARVLVHGVELEDPFSPDNTEALSFRGDSNLLYWFLEETQSVYRHQTLEKRVRIALEICSQEDQPDVASLMRGLLGDQGITPAICHIKDSPHRTLLHSVSWHLGEQFFRVPQTYYSLLNRCQELIAPTVGQTCKDPIERLLLLAFELVAVGSDIHALAYRLSYIAPNRQTPLVAIISGFITLFDICSPAGTPSYYGGCIIISPEILVTLTYPSKALVPVFLWLTLLANAGVDLSEYGRKEKLAYNWCYPSVYSTSRSLENSWWKPKKTLSFTFSYGPRPQEWSFWLIPAMDNSFRDFWDMVDHPERAMPGYWDDEPEDGYESDF